MASVKRIVAGATGVSAAVALLALPVLATGEESVTVGTSWTRQSNDIVCFQDCGTVDWTHKLNSACYKIAYARLRYVRDLQPDETHASSQALTDCDVHSYRHGVDAGRPHHQDGRVTYGSAGMTFGYKAS